MCGVIVHKANVSNGSGPRDLSKLAHRFSPSLLSHSQGVFLYYIDYRLPWSHVFSRINKLRRWFVVESVLVSESSLDEVLLGMARAEQAEDAAEAQLAAKDASRDAFAGDPWGREEQHKHERRQRLRDKRRRRDSPTHVGGTETHSIHCTGAGVGL